jgi:lipopolysaccharide export system permease protein
MKHLYRYLAVMFLQRFVIISLGLVALLGTLDALSNADLLPPDATLLDQFRYMLLRMPILFDRILVFAVLLALLLTYMSLIRRSELVAIVGAGVSVLGQIRALIPAVLIATVGSALLIDVVTPRSTQALENWLGPKAVHDDGQAPETLWLADNRLLVEIGGVEGEVLEDITLFERGADGKIEAISHAPRANATTGGWQLMNSRQIRYDGQPPEAPVFWETAQSPRTLRLLMSEPRNLAMADLLRLSRMTGSGSLPSDAYLVWFLNRLSLPVIALGFLMITVPIMQHFGRHDRAEISMGLAIGGGFVFMVADGVFKTLSENGGLDAEVAVSIPAGALLLIGLWLSLHRRGSV